MSCLIRVSTNKTSVDVLKLYYMIWAANRNRGLEAALSLGYEAADRPTWLFVVLCMIVIVLVFGLQ